MSSGFRGWRIVAVAFLAEFAATGIAIISYPLFAVPIQHEFGVSMLQFNLPLTPFSIVMTLAGFVVGPLLDRRPIRAIMALGGLVLALTLALMSLATTAAQLGFLFAIGASLSMVLLGPLAAMTVTAKWFERQRGRAIGVVSLSPLAAGVLLPQLCGALIEGVGWRATLRWLSLGTAAVVPLVWLVIRNRPEDIGQLPDGESREASRGTTSAEGPVWSPRALIAERAFWVIALAVGAVFGFLQAWTPNIGKYFGDFGYGVREQAIPLMAAGAIGIPGTLLCGWLAERRDPRLLIWIAIALQVAAFAAMRGQPGWAVLIAASAAIGVAAGGLTPFYAALLARTFGPASFGTAMGVSGLVMLPFAAAAPPIIGGLRDATGSYDLALLVIVCVLVLSAGVLALLPSRAAG
jgi:sugar phosphate permease